MFIPVRDANHLRYIGFQYVTATLIAVNVAVFLLELTPAGQLSGGSFALIPRDLFRAGLSRAAAQGPFDALVIPEMATLFTYSLLHGDILHIATNMMFLWVFGDNVEDAMGHTRFAVFYILCGLAAGLAHALAMPDSPLPLVGASGAVSGVIAAYLLLYPNVRVWVLALRIIPLNITAAFALGLWALSQIAMLLFAPPARVAIWAHVGGLVAGACLVLVMRRPGVGLFEKTLPPPPAS